MFLRSVINIKENVFIKGIILPGYANVAIAYVKNNERVCIFQNH